MLISIIVPFYNVERYFRACLDSIVHQTYRNLEILLIDDCSPDNSIEIAKEYAQKDDRIKIIRHEMNLRQGGARNTGLKVATGEYIWYIDSDDGITTRHAVQDLVELAQTNDYPEVLHFGVQRVNKEGITRGFADVQRLFEDPEEYWHYYMHRVFVVQDDAKNLDYSVCNKLYRRQFLLDHHCYFLENTYHEDVISAMWLPLAKRILIVHGVYYDYINRPDSTITGKKPDNYLDHLNRVGQQVIAYYEQWWKPRDLPRFVPEMMVIQRYIMWYIPNILNENSNPHHILVGIYDDMRALLGKEPALLSLDSLPSSIMAWPVDNLSLEVLLRSFQKEISTQKKYQYARNLYCIYGYCRRWSGKKLIKMLLPYGLVRIIQRINKR
ncbi:glycosyltransferase family 2 protein [Entomospira culicis]|uniref:Glycosyltransferase family 2 protein n=1 Tax=Entomospira culicis TaxID=2719989 RepID=A0A968GGM1_9SPIO|nr:glycosyltransferase family 2 protein [Entomospira culicis]NIZ19909.1 glycosyltransferase family 2 protein [Entomospira culicis]NIZ70134.1 glycosyltransferase family 2 protein [Entomospira culicis]WDI38061.1 glycosyltransferase family 2 protein [Entomospira culicis]WDI39684.1 glycosyltransferase family 2 protein [Entomospira culicis]